MPTTVSQPASKNQKRRRAKKPEMTSAQKYKLIDRHIERVKKADAGTSAATWRLADELAALVDAYKKCHKFPPSARKLWQLTRLDRDGSRMILLAKLAKFFPPELRKDGVGVRVYEAAYKTNNALKSAGRDPLTAEDLFEQIGKSYSADTVKDCVNWAAKRRDREADQKVLNEVRDNAQAVKPNYKLTARKWLKTFDMSPSFAIAAAIRLLPETATIDKINDGLDRLGIKHRLLIPGRAKSSGSQIDLFDDDSESDASNDDA